MQSKVILALAAASVASAQFVPPPAPVLLTSTKSGVLPVLPTPFSGVETLEGAIIMKAPANASYLPVNGPASVQSGLAPGATYVATLPAVPFNELTGTIITGTVTAAAASNGTGVTFTFNLQGFPDLATYGPFPYHIHDQPVPADGNCTSTLGHFDYTNAGEYYTCNKPTAQNCQIGDLAGKHGKINATSFVTSYTDIYLSTDPSSPYFFGARSLTIHTSNTTRLTCANFVKVAAAAANSSSSASSAMSMTSSSPVMSMTASTTSSGPVASYSANAAGNLAAGGVTAGIAALAAALLM